MDRYSLQPISEKAVDSREVAGMSGSEASEFGGRWEEKSGSYLRPAPPLGNEAS